MLLEYLSDGSPDCPLIRLYRFTPEEAASLRDAVVELSDGRLQKVVVHELPYAKVIAGCQLTLCVSSFDQSVVQKDAYTFECRYIAETWDNVAGLLKPYAEGKGGHQWLSSGTGDAQLLLSFSGAW